MESSSKPDFFKLLVSLISALGLAVFLGVLASWTLQEVLVGLRSNDWPKVEATVTNTFVRKDAGQRKDSPYFTPVIEYKFQANDGREFVGNRLTFFPKKYQMEEDAHKFLAQFLASEVTASYRPERPSESVLIPGTSWERCGCLALFVGLCVFFTYWVVKLTAVPIKAMRGTAEGADEHFGAGMHRH
jgi:hypothetical protein